MADDAAKRREGWLVLRAQAGDAEAFDALLKSVQGPLYRYVRSLVSDAAQAEDILQEVFLRIYRKLAYLREPELLRPWAYRIASREAFRHLRRERRWAEQLRDDAVLKAIPQAPARDDFVLDARARLPELVEALSPASRAVVVLYYLEEMSLGEVAAVLEIPLGTVKSRLAYGLAALRVRLNEQQQQRRS